jgi:phage baseplate assembly protein W
MSETTRRTYTQIDPINLETNVAIGVSLPFNGEGVFNSTYTTKEQAKSNLLNVLLTEPGERLYLPNFGVGIRNLLFEQNVKAEILKERISNQVDIYIPEIEVMDIKIDKSPDSHTLYIAIDYRMSINNDEDSIQINFNTGEETNQLSSAGSAGSFNNGGGGSY